MEYEIVHFICVLYCDGLQKQEIQKFIVKYKNIK